MPHTRCSSASARGGRAPTSCATCWTRPRSVRRAGWACWTRRLPSGGRATCWPASACSTRSPCCWTTRRAVPTTGCPTRPGGGRPPSVARLPGRPSCPPCATSTWSPPARGRRRCGCSTPTRTPAAAPVRAHGALAEVVRSGRVDLSDVDPPERVRALSGETVPAEQAVVLDQPWLLGVLPDDRVVSAGPDPLGFGPVAAEPGGPAVAEAEQFGGVEAAAADFELTP